MYGNHSLYVYCVSSLLLFTPCIRNPGRVISQAFLSTFQKKYCSSAVGVGSCTNSRLHYSALPGSSVAENNGYKRIYDGVPNSFKYGVYFVDTSTNKMISPWHQIPLKDTSDEPGIYNMIVEIPRYTTAKMEIATKENLNPIKQDLKNGLLRHYHGPIFWNYGALPQTWEDPEQCKTIDGAECCGDNDPLDIVDVSFVNSKQEEANPTKVGDIKKVKVLGALCLIDGEELDWKILAVNIMDEHAHRLNDCTDIDALYPGTTSGIREWFRWYKTPDGKKPNRYAYKEALLNREEALRVIEDNRKAYWRLLSKANGSLWVPREH